MKVQSNNCETTPFKFRIPSMPQAVSEGIDLLGMAELLLWVQAFLFSAVMNHYLPLYFLALSHVLGIPIGIRNYLRKRKDDLHCVPAYERRNVVGFLDYVRSKKAAQERIAKKVGEGKAG